LISRNASAAFSVGTDTRTRSAPALAHALIWATVAATSSVSVLVIVWIAIGASPPMATRPTRICRDFRRTMVCWGFIAAASYGTVNRAVSFWRLMCAEKSTGAPP